IALFMDLHTSVAYFPSPYFLPASSRSFFFSITRRPPSSPLFPYTTLFRSPHRPLAAARSGRAPRARRSSDGAVRAHAAHPGAGRSEEHTSELQSRVHLVCRLLLEKKKKGRSTMQSGPCGAAVDVAATATPC